MAIVAGGGFNPRAPCGARPASARSTSIWDLFQSTRPVRGATMDMTLLQYTSIVSIHAPRAGRDVAPVTHPRDSSRFNPRAPCGARLSNYTSLRIIMLLYSNLKVLESLIISMCMQMCTFRCANFPCFRQSWWFALTTIKESKRPLGHRSFVRRLSRPDYASFCQDYRISDYLLRHR